MQYGFPPGSIHLRRIETPDWVERTRLLAPGLTDLDLTRLDEQRDAVLTQLEATLNWALTDPEAIQRFQQHHTYATGVQGDYFLGRQFVSPWSSGELVIETECCLSHQDFRGQPSIYQRYTLTLVWDLDQGVGRWLASADTERESVLATLHLRRTGPESLAEVVALPRSQPTISLVQYLEPRWEEVLHAVDRAIQDSLTDCSSSGELDFDHFPSRLYMTGAYCINSLSGWSEASDGRRFSLMVHCLGQPFMATNGPDDYLGLDLEFYFGKEHRLVFEGWTTSAI